MRLLELVVRQPQRHYIKSMEAIQYPCYFLFGPSGGLQLTDVDSNQCLCLFTSEHSLKRFSQFVWEDTHGRRAKGYIQAEFDRCDDRAGLLGRLESVEASMAADGIRHIVIDPNPGNPVSYVAILELIADLKGDG